MKEVAEKQPLFLFSPGARFSIHKKKLSKYLSRLPPYLTITLKKLWKKVWRLEIIPPIFAAVLYSR